MAALPGAARGTDTSATPAAARLGLGSMNAARSAATASLGLAACLAATAPARRAALPEAARGTDTSATPAAAPLGLGSIREATAAAAALPELAAGLPATAPAGMASQPGAALGTDTSATPAAARLGLGSIGDASSAAAASPALAAGSAASALAALLDTAPVREAKAAAAAAFSRLLAVVPGTVPAASAAAALEELNRDVMAADSALFAAVRYDPLAFKLAAAPRLDATHLSVDSLELLRGRVEDWRLDRLLSVVTGGGVIPPGSFSAACSSERLAHGNHGSYRAREALGCAAAARDVRLGRTVLLDKATTAALLASGQWRPAPLGMVAKANGKQRVVWDGTFTTGVGDVCTNDQIDPAGLVPIEYAAALERFIVRLVGRKAAQPQERYYIGKLDVSEAFRQLPQRPEYISCFCYLVDGDHLAMDYRVTFGARHSAHCFAEWGEVIHQGLQSFTYETAPEPSDVPGADRFSVEEEGAAAASAAAAALVAIGEAAAAAAATATESGAAAQCPRQLIGVSHLARNVDGQSAQLESETYSDDSFLAETRRRFVKAMAALLLVHYWTLGPEAVNPDKILEGGIGSERQTVLGVEVDTFDGVLRLPQKKRELLRPLLVSWLDKREAPLSEVQSLAGKLRNFAECIRPGRRMMRRIYAATRGYCYGSQKFEEKRTVRLSQETRGVFRLWLALLDAGAACPRVVECPLELRIRRMPAAVIQTDASGWGAGAMWAAKGVFVQFAWPAEVLKAFSERPQRVTNSDLEMAGLVLGLGALAAGGAAPELILQAVQLRGDNMASLSWVDGGGGHGAVANALSELLGAIEVEVGCSLLSEHVAGVENLIPDDLSRRDLKVLLREGEEGGTDHHLFPLLHWRQVEPPQELLSQICSALLTGTSEAALQRVRAWRTTPRWTASWRSAATMATTATPWLAEGTASPSH